jgi:hypothetical protein
MRIFARSPAVMCKSEASRSIISSSSVLRFKPVGMGAVITYWVQGAEEECGVELSPSEQINNNFLMRRFLGSPVQAW